MPTLLLILILATACQPGAQSSEEIRPPSFAGTFYPESPSVLTLAIRTFMDEAVTVKRENPIAIIVPHAGYVYSGQICADGFKQVSNRTYDTVVLMGTNHTKPNVQKISIYPGSGFRTPLGIAEVNKAVVAALLSEDSDCVMDESLHDREHSIEVVLPFVQTLFPKAKIVPVVIGTSDAGVCERFGLALAKVVKTRRALIVASSDLSHYPAAEDASVVDRETLSRIVTLNTAALHESIRSQMARHIPNLSTCACGEAPIQVAMAAAKALGATGGTIVSYLHSGDVSLGEPTRVVGYGAVVLSENRGKGPSATPEVSKEAMNLPLKTSDKKALLAFARENIARFLATRTTPLARGFSPNLYAPCGAFVTLKKGGRLRGCIGHMAPDRPLIQVVGAMALQAAFGDPRFSPVIQDELNELEIEISVLTPKRPVASATDIVVGRDGVVLQKDGHSAVFLPQVATEQGWGRDEMLDKLCLKAGLPAGSWKEEAQLHTFQAVVFSEAEFKTSR